MSMIEMNHKVCDFTCMVNGLEDIYENAMNASLPRYFLFGLSAFCSPAYLKIKRSKTPRMFYPNAGQPGRLYDFLRDVLGYEVEQSEGRSFAYTFNKAKDAIDNGRPVLIGACDMYHLRYLDKFYHHAHIPIHYFLMTGYDDAAEQIILLDCGREEPQRLDYADLEKAWDAATPGFSKRNTMRVFAFPSSPPEPKQVFFQSLKKKTDVNLRRVPDFVGVSAFEKLAKELPLWQCELTTDEYHASLIHFVEYCGFPPSIPDTETTMDNTHQAARHEFADLLKWGAREYASPAIEDAAELFYKSGEVIVSLSKEIWEAAHCDKPLLSSAPLLLREIAALEKQANEILAEAVVRVNGQV